MTPQQPRKAQAGENCSGKNHPTCLSFLACTDATCSTADFLPSLVHAQPCSQPMKTKFSCRPVIVGDEKGKLLEVLLDEKEKRDPLVKAVYSFEDAPEKITGLEQHLAQQRTLVLVATTTRLYVFVGDRDLEPLFASYPESAGQHSRHTSLPNSRDV